MRKKAGASGKLLKWAEKPGIAIQHILENIEEAQDFATQWL